MTPTGLTRADLKEKGRRLLKKDGKQILLILSEERVYAIANRCPHEGYPLSEGTEGPGAVLTCNWHNWKFDLASGEALIGRDPVRTYKVEERSGEIYVDLSDPPPGRLCARALKGLDAAVADNDMARMAREVARLERAGFSAKTALVHAIAERNDHLENGMTHAHAAAADWLALAARASNDELRLAAMLEPLGHLAWDTQGADGFPYADGTAAWNARAFVEAVEAENEAAATAHVRGALEKRIPYAKMRPAFAEAALAHYADFGHCAIYVLKAGQLIERLGDDVALPVLLALTRMLVRATREERIPEFRGYSDAFKRWNGHGVATAEADGFVGLSIDAVLERTLSSSSRSPRELYDALLGAAAWNLLHFDLAVERATGNAIADNVSWLDFTHALTFANASRHLCEERGDLWPNALLQLALFVGRNKKYVTEQIDIDAWRARDRETFIAEEMATLYDHGIPEPIVACHRLKVLFALEDELTTAPEAPWADTMCAAVNRYLNTPMKRHHGLRIASQARDFVAKEG
ncbi:MAG TPA: Rieske (2Fe-2S) protein [Rhizomicrobium sp.]|nr:Rieske (2Fe-2S) protein [Rhizomicrobium sp.]